MGDPAPTADVIDLRQTKAGRSIVRTQNYSIERIAGPSTRDFAGGDEFIILLYGKGATLTSDGKETTLPARSVIIVPPGNHRIAVDAGLAIVLATSRSDIDVGTAALNAEAYSKPDARVAPVGEPFANAGGQSGLRIWPIDEVPLPRTNPRIKFIQSATMSINWVEYQGVRDRKALSPHDHADLEQASLSLAGNFVHHLRYPWTPDGTLWRDDVHAHAGVDSVLVVPPDIIHTSEGSGDGAHLLIDIFAPPRRDFIARDWMHNAADYRDPQKDVGSA